jgi:GMP synthase (glutamine-hydrolysing)
LCNDGSEDRKDFERIEPEVAALAKATGVQARVLPIRSVGVKADLRAYEHPVLLHDDRSWKPMVDVGHRIVTEVRGLNRAIWNLGPAMPQTVRPLRALMTRARLDLLREADAIVMDALHRHRLYDSIWQCPIVLVPLAIDGKGEEFVIVRPIHTERAMTASPAELTPAVLDELRQRILKLPRISGLALDLTSKPPGTIEWE